MLKALSAKMRQRGEAWISRRTPLRAAPVSLERRRLYILPTRGGLYFGLLVFVMLMGSMNYSNSLAFSLTFLLASIGLVCMHHTHRNLVNLTLRAGRQAAVFAGEKACFRLILTNPSNTHRFAVRLDAEDHAFEQTVDVPAGGEALTQVHVPAPRRGRLPAPRLRVHTQFPMGLFRAWSWVRLDIECMVYPKPAGRTALPSATPGDMQGKTEMHAGREDFAGLRRYERGDPPRLIHWKAYPRSQQLMIKQFSDPRESELWLDWNLTGERDPEAILSQLTRWVLEADHTGQPYGLRVPGCEIGPAHGGGHRENCLRELALYEAGK